MLLFTIHNTALIGSRLSCDHSTENLNIVADVKYWRTASPWTTFGFRGEKYIIQINAAYSSSLGTLAAYRGHCMLYSHCNIHQKKKKKAKSGLD